MDDLEHLAAAGITDPGSEGTSPDVSPSPEGGGQAAPSDQQQQQQEMFELNGNRFPVSTEFQLTHNGQIVKVPYSKLANTYRLSQHLEDQRTEFKTERQKHAEELQNLEKYKGFHDKYNGLQTWSEQNPQEWQRLYDLWQNKDKHLLNAQVQGQGQPDPNQPGGFNVQPIIEKMAAMEQQLQKYDKYVQTFEDQKRQAQEQKDVELVKGEMTSFKEEFPEINLDEKDPDGVALWAKIIQWGMQRGYRDFSPAAHMYLKPRIADTISSRARNEAIKGVKQDHQQGIVKRSTVPIGVQPNGQAGKSQPIDPRKLSYSELANLAKEGAFST